MRLDLRHLRHFIAVAEEQHYGRAAEKLHMTQPSLSLSISNLEQYLGVELFDRNTRRTIITEAGLQLLTEARRVFSALEQVEVTMQAVSHGYRGHLRIGIADALGQPRLAEVFALSREEEPDVALRIQEMPVSELIHAVQHDALDVGFTLHPEAGRDYLVEPVWHDEVAVVMLARHPLLSHKRVPLSAALKYPLILAHPEMCQGGYEYIEAMLARADPKERPVTAARVSGHESMLTLIGSGLGIGFAIESQVAQYHRTEVAVRPMEVGLPPVITHLMRADRTPAEQVERFIERVRRVGGLPPPEEPELPLSGRARRRSRKQ